MKDGKYVVFEDGDAIVFPKHEIHAWKARDDGRKPISAGFFSVSNGNVRVFGLSSSLGLSSDPEDVSAVEKALNLCPECGGTGEVTVDEYNPDSHQWEPTGTARCHVCNSKPEPEHDNDD